MEKKQERASETGAKQKKNFGKKVLAGACIVLAAFFFFTAGWFCHILSLGDNARSLLWAVKTVENHFYGNITEDELYNKFFDDFSLDPYSEYYTREEYESLYSQHAGNHADFGLQFRAEGEALRIVRTVGNSPAERAGISGGMYVLAYGKDGENLKTGGLSDFRTFVSGLDSVVLRCGYDPEGTDARLYEIEREDYSASAVLYRDGEGALRFVGEGKPALGALAGIPADTAYIRLDEFYGTAASEMTAALSAMKARGKHALILDLRSNGGGYLSVFQQIAALLLRNAEERTPVVAYSRDNRGKETVWRAPANRFREFFGEDCKIYILADEMTASASECLIGALVSYGTTPYERIFLRAETGKTYGKGIMQSAYTDSAGNVLKLTSAQMYWPNGTTIHGVGVRAEDGAAAVEAPDIPSETDVFLQQVFASIQ